MCFISSNRVRLWVLAPGILALGLLGAGCQTPVPDPAEEAPTLPERFSGEGGAEVASRWWEAFDRPGLNDLVESALAENFELKSALARLREARAVAWRSSAEKRPEVDAEGSARREGGDGAESDRYFAGVSASYEVDVWGRLDALAEADRLRAGATAEEVRSAAVTLSAETALAWLDGLAARGGVELLRRQVEDNESLVELLRNRFRAGQAERVDLLRQRQLLLETRRRLTEVRAEVKLVEHRLAILTGRAPGLLEGEEEADVPGVPPLPETGVPLRTLERRPDVRAAWLRIRAADREVAAAVSDRLPRISLSASIGAGSEEVSNLFSDWLWTLAGNVAAPLLDGGRRRAEVERTEAVLERRLADYGQTMLEAVGEVEDALVRERRQADRVRDLVTQRDLAEETLEQLRIAYRNGVADFLDVLSARTGLQRLERELLFARRDRLRFRVALYRALAGGFNLQGDDDDGPNENN